MTDDQLREWYRARIPRSPVGGHPPPEAVVALVRREGTESDRLATLDHVMQCRDCRGDFELLRSIATADQGGERWWAPQRLALAAAVILAVATTAWWRLGAPGSGEPVVRGGGSTTGMVVVEPVDSIVSAQEARRFVWRPVSGATLYRFELLGDDGRVIYQQGTADTVALVPDSIAVPAGSYRWLVTAVRPAGEPATVIRPLRVR